MKLACSIASWFCLGACCFAVEPPRADVEGFQSTVAPLLRKYCSECHGRDLQEANLSLLDINPNLLGGPNFEAWRLVREQLHFGAMPPQDSPQPTASERARILKWLRQELLKTQLPGGAIEQKLMLPTFGNYVDHDALFAAPAGPVIPATSRIWRIRPAIYQSFATATASGDSKAANPFSVASESGFKDYASLYFIDEPTTDMLLANAERIVEQQVNRNGKSKAIRELIREDREPTPTEVANAIHDAFRVALQRPATDEEIGRFTAFYAKASTTGDRMIGARAMLMAILLQPEAMFRQELGTGEIDPLGRQRLAQRDIAYALSFTLGDVLDPELLKLADSGKLATKEQVAAYVRDRLANAKEKREQAKKLNYKPITNTRIMQFFREYFQYPQVTEVFKDQPAKGRHESERLLQDLDWTVQSILDEDREVLRQLLTTNRYHVNYSIDPKTGVPVRAGGNNYPLEYHTAFGLPADWKWDPQQPIEFPKDERAGILTHPAWLAAFSGNFDNHPVQRGKWIRTHLLGGTVADLPIGVDARIPEDETKTLRHRLDMVTTKSECWRCHKKMNDLGTPFENYDHYGRYRRFEIGAPVNAKGKITLSGVGGLDGDVTCAVELMHKLARSQHVEQVFVRHAFRFFMGRNETLGDAATLQQAYQAYKESGGSFNSLVVSLLASDSFLYRKSSTATARK